MGRQTVIVVSATFILVLTAILFFTGKGRRSVVADPYSSVTDQACFIVETVDLLSFMNSMTDKKGLTGEMSSLKDLSDFNGRLKYISDNLNKTGLRNLTSSGRAIISFYPGKSGKLGTLLSMPVDPDIRQRSVRQALTDAGVPGIIEIKSGKSRILTVPYSENKDTVFFLVSSGLLLVSNSSDVLWNSFTTLESGTGVLRFNEFSRVLKASGNNEDKIFVLFKNLPEVLKPVFSPSISPDSFSTLAMAGGGDIYLNNEGLVLSGFTETVDSSDILYRFKTLLPAEFTTYRILPSSTALFETVVNPFTKSYYNDSSGNISGLASAIASYIGDEITRAYIEIRGNTPDENNMIIYEMDNIVQAEQLLSSFAVNISWFRPDEQVSIPVYHLSSNGLGKSLFPVFRNYYSDSLVAFYDRYMITGGSNATISKLLYDNLLNNTLANDLGFRDFESSMPSRSSYFLYCVPSKIITYLDGVLSDRIIQSLKENRNSLNKIRSAGFQLASSNGMVYNSLSVRFKDEIREESRSEWETLLDTTAGTKPFFFTNHLTGAKEIFVQDLKNNIYLINAAGRVLWKVPLAEKIIGAIYMIDFYRNGKYQILFNGKNYLHLIDRNGNYVERYPVKLRSEAANSLSLFDYDNNKNYRIVIAGEDRMVYTYDKAGNVVKGWKPFRTAGTVRDQINYFRVSGKDYLVLSDETSLYLLDRYGNKRFNFKEPVTKAERSAIKLSSGSEPYLICSSYNGIIQHIYFDGSVKKFGVGKFSPAHSMDIFDIDSDGFDEFIFIDRGKLYLYDHNRIELFSREIGSGLLEGPITFSFTPENKKIGIFDRERNLIYLLDEKGTIIEGFPLKGGSMFSIGRLSDMSTWNLIVGGPDRFLYNYKIGTGI